MPTAHPPHTASPPARRPAGSYARIRRGLIAAEELGAHYATVHNRAVRDTRLSRRARGLLVELLSHADGYRVSVAALVATGPEGRDAVRGALVELERYGYLARVRRGREDGRLGEVEYRVTDMPEGLAAADPRPGADRSINAPTGAPKARRRRPHQAGEPSSDGPLSDFPPPKKTKIQNTNSKNTMTSRPSVSERSCSAGAAPGGTDGQPQHHHVDQPAEQAAADGAQEQPEQDAGPMSAVGRGAPPAAASSTLEGDVPAGPRTAAPPPRRPCRTGRPTTRPTTAAVHSPGAELLARIGAQHPAYLLTGRTLADQGLIVTGMLDAGWTSEQIRHAVTARPLPEVITTSVGAIVARRLRDAAAVLPASRLVTGQPALAGGGGSDAAAPLWEPAPGPPPAATPTPPAYGHHHTTPPRAECDGDNGGCGRPVRPGYDRCTTCLALPTCGCGVGRYDPTRGEEQCPACHQAHTALTARLSTTFRPPAASRLNRNTNEDM